MTTGFAIWLEILVWLVVPFLTLGFIELCGRMLPVRVVVRRKPR